MVLIAPNHVESGTGRLLALETASEQGAESGKYQCKAGDVVYSKIRPALRKVCLAPEDCLCSADMYPLRAYSGLHNTFLIWWMLSEQFSSFAALESQRVAMPKINRESLKEVMLLVPTPSEQERITTFLDRETARIDALVAQQERLIELLREKRQAVISHAVTKGLDPKVPMKDSGVEWLGEVPGHWSIAPLKRVADVQTGVAKGKDNEGRSTISVPYLRVANVQDGYLDLDSVASIEIPIDDLPRYSLLPGDVLMNEGGDFDKLGRGHIWSGEIHPCIHQNHVFAVRPRAVSAEWLNTFTSSAPAQFYFMTRSKQSTNLASISSTNLMELPLPLPQSHEQKDILERVETIATRHNTLIAEAERAITLLQERRAALITAAVTGQIDVRGLA
jgi:type I restriction enzyme S subunit